MNRSMFLKMAGGLAVSLALTGCQAKPTATNQQPAKENVMGAQSTRQFDNAPGMLPDDQIKQKDAVIETSKGTVTVELYADDAPLTVSNFVFLANHAFYDGLTFHRYEPGFVIQGGDPLGNGTGGPGYKFADEPVTKPYSRGIVAMANAGPNTNGSQFFIMLKDTPLPPAYTIFGTVTSGMDAVDQLRKGDTMTKVSIVDHK